MLSEGELTFLAAYQKIPSRYTLQCVMREHL